MLWIAFLQFQKYDIFLFRDAGVTLVCMGLHRIEWNLYLTVFINRTVVLIKAIDIIVGDLFDELKENMKYKIYNYGK